MHYEVITDLLNIMRGYKSDKSIDDIIEYYLNYQRLIFEKMDSYTIARNLLSELNYDMRANYKSSELNGFKVKPGDICYIDFGKAYINEAGYQHFGLVLNCFNSKALVVPMSSNLNMYNQSYCEKTYPYGKTHLYRLPQVNGLKRKSVLFLNDIKYINTARIIEVKGNIDCDSSLFSSISERALTLI